MDLPQLFWPVFMAGVTKVLGVGSRMTVLTGCRHPTVVELKGVLGKLGGPPGKCIMTPVTIRPKEAGMDNRLCVAVEAVGGYSNVDVFRVAVLANDVLMLASQGKAGLMIKRLHPPCPVMAFQAAEAVCLQMQGHHFGVRLHVTGCAVQIFLEEAVFWMAGTAVQRFILVVFLVAEQTEACQPFVIDILKRKSRNVRLTPLVFGMAGITSPGRQAAMQAIGIHPLPGDFKMTGLALIFGNTVDGCVAVAAVLFKLGMGGEATKRPIAPGYGR
jgi:hypothetical protein